MIFELVPKPTTSATVENPILPLGLQSVQLTMEIMALETILPKQGIPAAALKIAIIMATVLG